MIFDALTNFDNAMQRRQAIADKRRQIRSATERRCGNCEFWMAYQCVPEKQRGEFKSCDSSGCELFQLKPLMVEHSGKLQAELAALEQ